MIGTQVGSWRILKHLASGGMGNVFLAEHTVMKDWWAVKVLAEELTQRDDVVARFVNEARAAAKVRHRNLIRVFQIDRVPNGPWYMVLEYLEGSTLGAYIYGQRVPVSYAEIVRLLSQVASALQALHKKGIIHRDLKPENVFLVARDSDDRCPVLLDLGVASLGDLSTGVATQRGTVLGTPCYMAPEQLLGEAVHPQADVYALGVMVYEMCTGGWLPYQQDWETRDVYVNLTTAELYRRQAGGPPVDPRRRNPGISDAWARVLFHLLEVDPGKRLSDAKSAAIALAKAMPVDGMTDGLAIVRQYAPELLQADNMLETLRSPRQAVLTPAGSSTEARYALGNKIGAGGMAEVFIGTQIGEQGFERKVAIKRVLAELSAQPGFAAMFIAEARIASRLAHSNIVSVIDFRRDAENRLFLVMEYVDGKDLAALLAAGSLPPSTIIYVIVETLRGVGYAHARLDEVTGTRGIVHRDISPHNVMVSYEGDVKINDFGLARVRDGGGWAGSTRVAGKPSYMSPEQVRGEPLDNRSDLWAVGVMLYEMLIHRPMFTGSVMEIMGQVQFQAFPRPSAVRLGVPLDLEAVAMKLLQRDAQARYASAELAIADLLRCANAPINGRDELAAHLAARFAAPTPRRGTADVAPVTPPTYEERITSSAAAIPSAFVGSVPSTLGSAASQSSPEVNAQLPPRRRSSLIWLAPAIILVFVIVGLVAARRHQTDTSPALVATSADSRQPQPSQPAAGSASSASTSASHSRVLAPPVAPSPSLGAAAAVSPVDAGTRETGARLPAPSSDTAVTGSASGPRTSAAPHPAPTAPAAGVAPSLASHAPTAHPTTSQSQVAAQAPAPSPRGHVPSSAAPSVASATAEPGEIVILVNPWATVWINNKQVGTTPFRKTLPSGKYVVRLSNDDLGKNETVNLTIEPNQPATIRRNW